MAIILAEHFENGSNQVAISTSNSSASAVAGTDPHFTNQSLEGVYAAQFDTAASQSLLRFDISPTSDGWFACYIRIEEYPSANEYIASFFSGISKISDIRINTNGTVTVRDNNSAVITSGLALNVGSWERLAIRVRPGQAQGLQLRMYLGDDRHSVSSTTDQVANSTVVGAIDNVRFGILTASTYALKLDHIIGDNSAEPAPSSSPEPVPNLVEELFNTGPESALISNLNTSATSIVGTSPQFISQSVEGSYAAHCVTVASQSLMRFNISAQNQIWISWYFRLNAQPVSPVYIASVFSGTTKIADVRINSDQTLSVRDNNLAVITTPQLFSMGSWERVALYIEPGAGGGLRLKTYSGGNRHSNVPTSDQSAGSTVSGAIDNVRVGIVTAADTDYDVDRLIVTSSDEPIGHTPNDLTVRHALLGGQWRQMRRHIIS